jgi:zinc protease
MPAAAAPDLPKIINKLPAVEAFELPNGLRVAVLRSDAAPVVSVQVWYRVGSKDEARDHRGSAHMFEHLMYRGTVHVRSEGHTRSIIALGGYSNAATDEDATHYFNTLPAGYVDYAIALEAERMRNLLFSKPAIDAEREVVKDEIRQQESSPFAAGLARCLAVEFQNHPYAWTATGAMKDLDAMTADGLKKFYDAYYQPNNAMLVVVGKVTAADVKASAEKWFGPIPKAADPPRPAAAAQEPPQTATRRETLEPSSGQVGQLGRTLIAWHLPRAKDKDSYALQLASLVLGAGESSRLRTRLKTVDPKTKRALAVEAGMEALIREDPGAAVALAAYLEAGQADAAEAALFDEVGKLATRGPSADELRKAKNQLQSGYVFSLENTQGLAETIGRTWILTGDPASFVREVDEVEKVSAADVQRVVKQYLSRDHATVVAIPPRAR